MLTMEEIGFFNYMEELEREQQPSDDNEDESEANEEDG